VTSIKATAGRGRVPPSPLSPDSGEDSDDEEEGASRSGATSEGSSDASAGEDDASDGDGSESEFDEEEESEGDRYYQGDETEDEDYSVEGDATSSNDSDDSDDSGDSGGRGKQGGREVTSPGASDEGSSRRSIEEDHDEMGNAEEEWQASSPQRLREEGRAGRDPAAEHGDAGASATCGLDEEGSRRSREEDHGDTSAADEGWSSAADDEWHAASPRRNLGECTFR
jgi:hypothetical protein